MVRQYVGARYVPKFADPVAWASGTSYEAMTIVTYNNSSYTSKVPVPATVGNPADNPDYWALTGNYNAQVEQYRQETETVSNNLTTEITNRKNADTALQDQITTVSNTLTTVSNNLTTVSNNLTTEIADRKNADTTFQDNINSEAATRASADSNLQSQINQIVAPSGEAPSAAEVQNARIGADGVTYATLGTAIRSQVNNLNEDLIGLYEKRPHIKNDWEIGTIISNGTPVDNNYSIRTSNFISVVIDTKIVITKNNSVGDFLFFTYKQNGEFLKFETITTDSYTTILSKNYLYKITIYAKQSNPVTLSDKPTITANILTDMYVNVEDFGASETSDDNTIAFQNAIDYAYKNKLRVLVPDKNYNVGLLMMRHGTVLEGISYKGQCWKNQTALKGVQIIVPNDVWFVSLKNLALIGNSENDVIHVDDYNSELASTGGDVPITIEHCDIQNNYGGNGLYVGIDRKGIIARDSPFRRCNNGAFISGSDCTFDNCAFGENKASGIVINAWVTSVIACGIYGNYRGITVKSTGSHSVIIASSIDHNRLDGIYNEGCYNLKVIGCTVRSNKYTHFTSINNAITSIMGCQISPEGGAGAKICLAGNGTYNLTDCSINGGYQNFTDVSTIYRSQMEQITEL